MRQQRFAPNAGIAQGREYLFNLLVTVGVTAIVIKAVKATAENRNQFDRAAVTKVVQPDRDKFKRMFAAVAQFAGVGCFLAQYCRNLINNVRGGRKHAIRCGIVLSGQCKGIAAIMVGAKNDHQVGFLHGERRPLPNLGVDNSTAWVVDMRAEQPKGRRRH